MKITTRLMLLVTSILMASMFATSLVAAENSLTTKTLAGGGKVIVLSQLVTGTTAVISQPFSLDGFLENTSTYPLSVDYSIDTSNVAAGVDIDSVSILIKRTNDPDLTAAHFLTTDTLTLTGGTTAYTNTTLDLNSHKGAYWEVVTTGLGANTAATVKLNIYLYRRDTR